MLFPLSSKGAKFSDSVTLHFYELLKLPVMTLGQIASSWSAVVVNSSSFKGSLCVDSWIISNPLK